MHGETLQERRHAIGIQINSGRRGKREAIADRAESVNVRDIHYRRIKMSWRKTKRSQRCLKPLTVLLEFIPFSYESCNDELFVFIAHWVRAIEFSNNIRRGTQRPMQPQA